MTRRVLELMIVAVGAQACVLSRQVVSPLGRTVRIVPVSGAAAQAGAGELMAVSPDSVWVARNAEIVSIPLAEVERVEVPRSKLGAGSALAYSVLLGLATGGALSAACSSVQGADCGGVLPAVLVSALVVGGLAAFSLESSAHLGIRRADWQVLRAYARFPQGLPDGLPRHRVGDRTSPRGSARAP